MKDQLKDKPELNEVKESEEAQTDTACDPGYHKDANGNCVPDGGNDTHPKPPVPNNG